ncbi:type I polyketide synthase [Dactylosporangium sp. NPDC005555]|uniref:type I polyketide synthase n=1 Tax=Dactylosporangium sp. NPDC005555 TaxID=3154889 RepID=UPI0033A1207F
MTDYRQLAEELLLERYEPVAVVGAGLRFPGGNDTLEGFAEFLREGRSGITPIPAGRWDVAGLAATGPGQPGRVNTAGGGFVEDFDHFDAQLFTMSPKEAQYVDPQHRLALEVSWAALEHANLDTAKLRGAAGGVYIGVSCFDYSLDLEVLGPEQLEAHIGTGTAHSAVPGRVSHVLGWRGPSIAVDTACSSSLVALHLAVEGLRRRECDVALAGGVSLVHHPRSHIAFSHAVGMLAPDGQCKTFDDSADGYARSEGCGMVVLKRMSDAQRDGNRILALVRGTAVRHDGDSGGLTVPNGTAQELVMRAAFAAAALDPHDVQAVEAHGTGTALGDPIEMGAIAAVFAGAPEPVAVSSLKTNVGHMEPAAGIGGLVKAVLQVRDGELYPHLNLRNPSRHIPWDDIPVTVPTARRDWAAPTRRALVNSFGFAGSIAAAIVEQPPAAAPIPASPAELGVFTLSARTPAALRRQVEQYRRFVDAHPDLPVDRVCATANLGRTHLGARLAGPVRDREDLVALLSTGQPEPDGPRRVAFLFSGQGTQRAGMGAALYRRFPVFRHRVDDLDARFAAHLGCSVRAASDVERTRHAQPALFTVEFALAELWRDWGVRPDVVAGHSIGEIVAATVAGVFTLDDAVTLVAARARLMDAVAEPGAMAAVEAPAADVADVLDGRPGLAFAALNAPGRCVLSGAEAQLADAVAELAARGVRTRRLHVSHAFHSPLMAPVLPEFRKVVAELTFHEPRIPLASNVTGRIADPDELCTPEYWVRHVAEPVRFADGMAAIGERGPHTFVELGPGGTLVALGRRCLPGSAHRWLLSLDPTRSPAEQDEGTTLRSLSALYRGGAAIRWDAFHAGQRPALLDLPAYAFDRRRYWMPEPTGQGRGGPLTHPLLGIEDRTTDGFREFAATVSADEPGYLRDHEVGGQPVLPGAAYLELLLALQDTVFGETGRPLTGVRFHEPLLLPDGGRARLRTRVQVRAGGDAGVEIVSVDAATGIEHRHATAVIGAPGRSTVDCLPLPAPGELSEAAAEDLYADFAEHGLRYGPAFRRVERLARDGDVAVAELRGHDTGGLEVLPPFLLDAAMQTLGAVAGVRQTALPVRVRTVRFFRKPKGPSLRSVARHTGPAGDADVTGDVTLFDGDRPVCHLEGLGIRLVAGAQHTGRRLLHTPVWTKRAHVRRDSRAVPVHLANQGPDGLHDSGPGGDVCWFWQPHDGLSLREQCERNYRSLLGLLAELGGGLPGEHRLWLVTTGAQRLPGDPAAPGQDPGHPEPPAAATLWGFGTALWREHPNLRVTLVDLEDGSASSARALAEEWRAAEPGEFQIAYRGGARHVRRLRVGEPDAGPAGDVELVLQRAGSFDALRPVPMAGVPPRADEIQVRLHAAGLNFKDVINALGLLGDDPLPLGFEGAGVVVESGPDAGFRPGDEVIVSHLGCLRGLVTVPSLAAVAKPAGLGWAEAATLPVAFVTAWHALHDLGGLGPGDRVLVHAAAGGVGQAAVQLATAAGAEVFATAGRHKHDLLRRQGVAHVFDSRSPGFADGILERTGGAGVDLVLNSLNGEFIPAGLRALAPGGRFVELGKLDVWTPEQMRAARPDVTYACFDLSETDPGATRALHRRILTAVLDGIAAGTLRPLPTTLYTIDEAAEAFGVLNRGANVGKLAIGFPPPAPPARPVTVRPDRAYVITGGLGALGVRTARRLAAAGARHLTLLGRRPDPDAVAALRERLGPAVELTVETGDVARAEDVTRLFARLAEGPHPVGGIVHAAGLLADAPAAALTWEAIDAVLGPKVYGGSHLHRATAGLPSLDFFVAYSSASAILGAAGQSNYAAANAYLDALMDVRAGSGLPGVSLGWGPWDSAGMAAGLDPRMRRRIEAQGVRFLDPATATRAMTRLLGAAGGPILVGEVDWDAFAAALPAANALYRDLARDRGWAALEADVDALRALPTAERHTAVATLIRAKVAEVLHFESPDDVGPAAAFAELGLDSLMAVELKNALERLFGLPLPADALLEHPTIDRAASLVARRLLEKTA